MITLCDIVIDYDLDTVVRVCMSLLNEIISSFMVSFSEIWLHYLTLIWTYNTHLKKNTKPLNELHFNVQYI